MCYQWTVSHLVCLLLVSITQTCWYKQVDFQHWNVNLLMIYYLKNVTDLVRMHSTLYQVGQKLNTVWNKSWDLGKRGSNPHHLYSYPKLTAFAFLCHSTLKSRIELCLLRVLWLQTQCNANDTEMHRYDTHLLKTTVPQRQFCSHTFMDVGCLKSKVYGCDSWSPISWQKLDINSKDENIRKAKIRNQYTNKIFYIKSLEDTRKFTVQWYRHLHDTKIWISITVMSWKDKKESNPRSALVKIGKRIPETYLEEKQRKGMRERL
jgi:hypothetical protein